VGLGLLTLALLTVLVFVAAQVLPGDPGRRILGPLADQRAVDALNARLGTDRGVLAQYGDWIGGLVQGDLGASVSRRRSVWELVGPALARSAQLALLAFVLMVPLGILGGVLAARREGRPLDRVISLGGLAASAVPEFVWAVVLIVVFSLTLGLLPAGARAPDGAGPLVVLEHLLLPALCLVLVLGGYIARIARAGTIEALRADYVRTAVLKGLPERTVLRRHVLRNALLPTIAVVATQTGYLLGGLVAVEVIFNYDGLGQLLFQAAQQKDLPLLEGGVLVVGAVYLVVALAADVLYGALDPRIRTGGAA
jgi:peptide/nickel transport system permease protein